MKKDKLICLGVMSFVLTMLIQRMEADVTNKVSGVSIKRTVDESFFGFHEHLNAKRPELTRLFKEAGGRTARMECPWRWVQPDGIDSWNWNNDTDISIKEAVANNIEPLVLVTQYAPWSLVKDGGEKEIKEEYIDDFGNFVFQLVSHYKGMVKYWQIANEPDIFQWRRKETWIDMLRVAYQGAKKANPDCKIVLCGFDGQQSPQLEYTYKNGGKPYFDIVATHSYVYPHLIPSSLESEFERQIKGLREVMDKYNDGKKPIWITEMAWISGKKEKVDELKKKDPKQVGFLYSEEESAKFLVRAHLSAISIPYIERFLYFKIMGPPPSWGLLEEHSERMLIPKRDFFAYKTLTSTLKGATCEERIELGEQARCVHFSKGEEAIFALWTIKDKLLLRVNIPIAGIRAFNIFGEPVVGTSKNVIGDLTVSDSPIYIVSSIKESKRIIELLKGVKIEGVKMTEAEVNRPLEGLTCVKTRSPVKIDGDLSEWVDIVSYHIENSDQVKMSNWDGKGDLSGTIYTQWDEENLYFMARIKDNVHLQNHSQNETWSGDSIQIGIDTLNNAVEGGYDEDDYEFGLALTKNGPEVYRWTWGSKVADSGLSKDTKLVVIRNTQTQETIYECAIPLSELKPLLPKVNEQVRFNVIINEDDGNGREGWLEITPGIGYVKAPLFFRKLTFAQRP